MNWSTPQRLAQFDHTLSAQSVGEILDGGQAFRWNLVEESPRQTVWEGIWGTHVVRILFEEETRALFYQTPLEGKTKTSETDVRHYLCLGKEYNATVDALPWRSDPVLQGAMNRFPELRILRQPLPETLLCFILSSTKQIPHIKAICEKLAHQFGEPLTPQHHALPTWERMAEIPEADLRALGMGYRAKFLKLSAEQITREENFFANVRTLGYEEAKQRLMQLHGVGEKIADCTLLFGGHSPEAFPVDTWIAQALRDLYGLQNFSLPQLAQFGRIHFGQQAGLAQQFLFSYYREKKKERTAR